MNFDQLDKAMRVFEAQNDTFVLPGIHMVARIDGRTFSQLTRNTEQFEAPYDDRFRDCMVATVVHLMDCGFRVIYGYTQSDEISLLFHLEDNTFGRKLRKYLSVLAGEASAKFSHTLGTVAAFDCRMCQLPSEQTVLDYFRWRAEDAHRNALNGHCYWSLRRNGMNADEANAYLMGFSVAQKNDFLFEKMGINFNDLPCWQRRGIGVYKERTPIAGSNPITGEATSSTRVHTKVDTELPMKDDYTQLIRSLMEHSELITPE